VLNGLDNQSVACLWRLYFYHPHTDRHLILGRCDLRVCAQLSSSRHRPIAWRKMGLWPSSTDLEYPSPIPPWGLSRSWL